MNILLAQTDKNLSQMLMLLLKSYNYNVIVTNEANQTIKQLEDEFPDIILIDQNLKGDSGIHLSKIIKENFLTSFIPIIILIDRRQLRRQLLDIEQGIDDYIVSPPDPIDLQIRIEIAVKRSRHQFYVNPLTRLPSSNAIEVILRRLIDLQQKFSFGYVDIDGFKYFNDKYGYHKGDMVIIQTSRIISRIIKQFGNQGDFVGHIGGDDFVFITSCDKEKIIATEIIKEFDRIIPYYYSGDDRKTGFIQVKDRQAKLIKVPLMSISIAIVNNQHCNIDSIIQLSETAFEIKNYLKTLGKSTFLVNRRIEQKEFSLQGKHSRKIHHYIEDIKTSKQKKPLGQILIDDNILDENTLSEALLRHWRTGKKLGDTLLTMGLVTPEKLDFALKKQQLLVNA